MHQTKVVFEEAKFSSAKFHPLHFKQVIVVGNLSTHQILSNCRFSFGSSNYPQTYLGELYLEDQCDYENAAGKYLQKNNICHKESIIFCYKKSVYFSLSLRYSFTHFCQRSFTHKREKKYFLRLEKKSHFSLKINISDNT